MEGRRVLFFLMVRPKSWTISCKTQGVESGMKVTEWSGIVKIAMVYLQGTIDSVHITISRPKWPLTIKYGLLSMDDVWFDFFVC